MTFLHRTAAAIRFWVLGHLTLIGGHDPAILFGDKNPAADWQQYFGENSNPVADASAYPPFTEVREKYLQLREQNLNLLESLSEKDLDKPTKAPPKGTRAGVFYVWPGSFPYPGPARNAACANVDDARRAAGRIALATRAGV